ncbi:MAG: hypothetical protein IPM79_04360 [Polyangiaceae bacterium]|nr:hypothetical protein [Polyangiaceae bacterium]
MRRGAQRLAEGDDEQVQSLEQHRQLVSIDLDAHCVSADSFWEGEPSSLETLRTMVKPPRVHTSIFTCSLDG